MSTTAVDITCPHCRQMYRIRVDLQRLARVRTRAVCSRCNQRFDVAARLRAAESRESGQPAAPIEPRGGIQEIQSSHDHRFDAEVPGPRAVAREEALDQPGAPAPESAATRATNPRPAAQPTAVTSAGRTWFSAPDEVSSGEEMRDTSRETDPRPQRTTEEVNRIVAGYGKDSQSAFRPPPLPVTGYVATPRSAPPDAEPELTIGSVPPDDELLLEAGEGDSYPPPGSSDRPYVISDISGLVVVSNAGAPPPRSDWPEPSIPPRSGPPRSPTAEPPAVPPAPVISARPARTSRGPISDRVSVPAVAPIPRGSVPARVSGGPPRRAWLDTADPGIGALPVDPTPATSALAWLLLYDPRNAR